MFCVCSDRRVDFLPVDVEGQEDEEGCRSSNIRENDPPSARVRENKRTQNHYQDNQKENKDHNKCNSKRHASFGHYRLKKRGQYGTIKRRKSRCSGFGRYNTIIHSKISHI
ncbi:hypothetical protein CDAR_505491 [Caerostris darwini]|uniref:Uncharacterized protein n=1 Tax=Caerostris darwini TaxID=1538125 RepID=A0AAV4UQ43_9ARAC|nr:hypothetical protein CDAR_505491 [Caerostris darwini]